MTIACLTSKFYTEEYMNIFFFYTETTTFIFQVLKNTLQLPNCFYNSLRKYLITWYSFIYYQFYFKNESDLSVFCCFFFAKYINDSLNDTRGNSWKQFIYFFSELCSFFNGMCLTAKVIFDSDV